MEVRSIKYVFLSYSSKNSQDAFAIKAFLESNGIKVWIANHEISPGADFTKSIYTAIKNCSCFVLLLTKECQESDWVHKELKQAISDKKPIVPVWPKPFALNESFEFSLIDCQILTLKQLDINDSAAQSFITSVKNTMSGKLIKPLRNAKPLERKLPKKVVTIAVLVIFVLIFSAVINGLFLSDSNTPLSDLWDTITKQFSSAAPSANDIDQIPQKYNNVILAAQHSDSSLRKVTVKVGEYTTTQSSSVWPDCTIYSKDSRIAIGEGPLVKGVSTGETYILVVSQTGSAVAYHVTVTE